MEILREIFRDPIVKLVGGVGGVMVVATGAAQAINGFITVLECGQGDEYVCEVLKWATDSSKNVGSATIVPDSNGGYTVTKNGKCHTLIFGDTALGIVKNKFGADPGAAEVTLDGVSKTMGQLSGEVYKEGQVLCIK